MDETEMEKLVKKHGYSELYKAAYNKGIEDACGPVRDRMIGYEIDDADLARLEKDIRALEKK